MKTDLRNPAPSVDLDITNVRPNGGALTSLSVRNGRIESFGPLVVPPAGELIDGGGALMIPGLVEAHTHLDKNLIGMPWYRNEVGPRLIDKIDNERAQRRILGIEPARQSARQVALSVAKGSTHIRTHVDVDTEVGLAGIEGVMATRERYRDVVDSEIVAFPQSGMLVRPGTVALMEGGAAARCRNRRRPRSCRYGPRPEGASRRGVRPRRALRASGRYSPA